MPVQHWYVLSVGGTDGVSVLEVDDGAGVELVVSVDMGCAVADTIESSALLPGGAAVG